MACSAWKKVLLQSLAICAAGVGAGVIDSTLHPIKIHPHVDQPPGPAHPANALELKPGDAGWKPAAQADMPAGQITLDQAKAYFDQGPPGVAVVDARGKADYEAGHIKNAFRINLKSFENGDPPLLAMIPRDATVLVYCSGGHCDESEHVADFMKNSGYKNVLVIHDGFPGWKAVGYPIETGEGTQ
jgi:rhodanese-related sulfurtransferase